MLLITKILKALTCRNNDSILPTPYLLKSDSSQNNWINISHCTWANPGLKDLYFHIGSTDGKILLCWGSHAIEKHYMITKHNTPSCWHTSSLEVLEFYGSPIPPMESMESMSTHSFRTGTIHTTSWHCTGLVTLDGRWSIMELWVQQGVTPGRHICFKWRIYSSIPGNWEEKVCFPGSFEDQLHNGTTGGEISQNQQETWTPLRRITALLRVPARWIGCEHIHNQRRLRKDSLQSADFHLLFRCRKKNKLSEVIKMFWH